MKNGMGKRVLAMILAVIMLQSSCPSTLWASEETYVQEQTTEDDARIAAEQAESEEAARAAAESEAARIAAEQAAAEEAARAASEAEAAQIIQEQSEVQAAETQAQSETQSDAQLEVQEEETEQQTQTAQPETQITVESENRQSETMGQDVSAEKTEADITTKEVSSAIHYENIQMADGTRIDVDIPAGALPEGTDMRIFGVDLSENIQDAEKAAKAQRVLAALEKAVGQKLDQDQIAAYDMYFCEEEVSEDIHIQPEYPVTLTFKDVRVAGESAMVFHIPDDYNKNAELVSGTDLNPGGTVAIGENGTVTVTVEKAKEFSVYAIVGVKDAEEETEAVTEESTEAESETVFEEEKDIVDFGMFTFEDGSSVHVTTEQGVFPEGTQLKVTQVDRQLALQNAIKATGNENLTERYSGI